jgi:UDP-2,3-diacylglucosamine pyrophosphatase LpxH
MTTDRLVFIISDLHIGGAYARDPSTGDRGFRLCTNVPKLAEFVAALDARSRAGADVELLINGDFIDFLAEVDEDGSFSPFRRDPQKALQVFNQIVAQDQILFDALKQLLAGGAMLTLLLGNHDVELCFPAVRKRLEEVLGVSGHTRFRFLYDGEALVIGDALIEHGNRYDPWNQVDHDQLRRLRSIQSRLQAPPADFEYVPPSGSRLVATVMNPIKRDYPFVDLLKPEQETMLPILLALEPDARSQITKLLPLMATTTTRGVSKEDASMPAQLGNISDVSAAGPDDAAFSPFAPAPARPRAPTADQRLDDVMTRLVGKDHAGTPAAETEDKPMLGDISFRSSLQAGFSRARSLVSLLLGQGGDRTGQPMDDKRVRDLRAALRAWQTHGSFDEGTETTAAYLEAARKLAQPGRIRYVVFGHTHLAKRVELKEDGVVYLNSGTWGDLMRLPDDVLADTPESVPALTAFLDALRARDYTKYLYFRPTFVRLAVGADDRVSKADLVLYTDPSCV